MHSLFAGFLLGCAGVTGEAPVAETANGPVLGFDREVEGQIVSSFQALPFAEPPLGALRFAYPVPYTQKWTQVRNSTQPPAACSQPGANNTSEDCLYLNVYTLRKALDDNTHQLPVMLWIFGGGFTGGDSWSNGFYDGANLVGRHDVVLVAGNYRLNAMGFSTYIAGPNGEIGSAAMADQRMGMQWTHDNIANFGGDPSKVTIFGESAGAFSVMYHLVSPPSWPFFSKAILESATSSLSWFYQPREEGVGLYESWAEGVGCPLGPDQLACLQAKPASDFEKLPSGFSGRSPIAASFPVGPVVDGLEHGLLGVPIDLVRAGKIAQIPIMLGANKNGGSIFEPAVGGPIIHKPEALNQDDVNALLGSIFLPEDSIKIQEVYTPSEFSSATNAYQKGVEQALRDLVFGCSDRELATAWTAAGLDTYLYNFAFDFGPVLNKIGLGDFHASEIAFVFKNGLDLFKKLPFAGNVQGMSDIISCQWTSFAYGGSPNGEVVSSPNCDGVHGKIQDWPRFGDFRSSYELNDQRRHKPEPIALRANNTYPDDAFPSDRRCDMWKTIATIWREPPTPLGASCSVGDSVSCPDSVFRCAGNECCQDGSTCPSADGSFSECPAPKTTDCTQASVLV